MKDKKELQEYRNFLKNPVDYSSNLDDTDLSDQQKGIPPPVFQPSYPKDAKIIDLISPEEFRKINLGSISLLDAIQSRKSHRKYSEESLSLEELSFLLWATQGVHKVDPKKVWTKRTVPSGGARHPFETYLVIKRVTGLEKGVYRYLPIDHKLVMLKTVDDEWINNELVKGAAGQKFVANAAVNFVWSVIPYKCEWRYSFFAHKPISLDAGHVCQNLYLACESIGAGTCAIAAYEQKVIDTLLDLDGNDEFVIYMAPVGKY